MTKYTTFRLTAEMRRMFVTKMLNKLPAEQCPSWHTNQMYKRRDAAADRYSLAVLPLDLHRYWHEHRAMFQLDSVGIDTVLGWTRVPVAPVVNLLPTGRQDVLLAELRAEVRAASVEREKATRPYEELERELQRLASGSTTSARLIEQMPDAKDVVLSLRPGGSVQYPVATDAGRQATAKLLALGATLP